MAQAPQYFGRLMPEREKMLAALMDLIRPHLGGLEVGQSEGFRLALVKEGSRERLKCIFEGKRTEVLL